MERWFRDLTDKRIRRDSFASVPELIGAIEDYIKHHNADPKPFKWTKSAQEHRSTGDHDKVNRCKAVLETLH